MLIYQYYRNIYSMYYRLYPQRIWAQDSDPSHRNHRELKVYISPFTGPPRAFLFMAPVGSLGYDPECNDFKLVSN